MKNEVDFVNADEANTLLQDVRNDSTPTNWVLFGHEGSKNVLKVSGVFGDVVLMAMMHVNFSGCQADRYKLTILWLTHSGDRQWNRWLQRT